MLKVSQEHPYADSEAPYYKIGRLSQALVDVSRTLNLIKKNVDPAKGNVHMWINNALSEIKDVLEGTRWGK